MKSDEYTIYEGQCTEKNQQSFHDLMKNIYHILTFFSDYFPSYIEPLVTQSMQWCDTYSEPLFIPMTSWLPSPYLPLVASLDCVDGANLIAPLRNNQHILCSYGLLDIAMYHIPSKKLLKLFSGKFHCRKLSLSPKKILICILKLNLSKLGHRSSVRCIILSHNEQYCISGSEDCTIRFWKFAEGLCTRVIR